jgi:hypothetical protein
MVTAILQAAVGIGLESYVAVFSSLSASASLCLCPNTH